MLEKISFEKYVAIGKALAKGVKRSTSEKSFWVKCKVSNHDWNVDYKRLSSYCMLSSDKDGVWVGFLAGKNMPLNCVEASDEDIMRIDAYRRNANIFPVPLSEILQKTTPSVLVAT